PDLPVIHYVAPSVWAWRPGRAAKMAQGGDHVLALLPCEPPLMRAAGMSCDVVGHPVVAEVPASETAADASRARHGLTGPLLLVLPGSRRGELARLGPRFAQTVRLAAKAVPGLRTVLPTLPHVAAEAREIAAQFDGLVLLDAAEKRAAFRAADA